MAKQAPGTPKGTRDFGPGQMKKREFILDTIKSVFKKYAFQALETPAIENLSVLTGKYGDEGDQLIFKILNSGEFLHKKGVLNISKEDLEHGESKILPKIAEKGLRYDLTVPFARYVATNFNELPNPFKRYQIQPVWRADRPQKGRYREFMQCDADVVGTNSLLCEAEILSMIREVFAKLGVNDYNIYVNHRGLLNSVANKIGVKDPIQFFVILDKLDKIGSEGVIAEFEKSNYSQHSIQKIKNLLAINGDNVSVLKSLNLFLESEDEGINSLNQILEIVNTTLGNTDHILISPTLARGLGYYTGAILEVKVNNVQIGSVSGGGRYDDLTGVFGLPDVSGVGFSFGVDRLYDVMEELKLFPDYAENNSVLVVHMDEKSFQHGLNLLGKLRSSEICSEIYPDQAKLKKQMQYADKKGITHTIVIGSQEMETEKYQLKNMQSGEQKALSIDDIIKTLN